MKNIDVKFTIFWCLLGILNFFYSLFFLKLELYLLRFLFYSLVIFLTFLRFKDNRVINKIIINYWAVFNINMFGFIFIYLEFKK